MEKWDGRELWLYPAGSVVTGIRTAHFDSDRDMAAYLDRQERRPAWREELADILQEFDAEALEPLYYCLACRRVEDGAHRYAAARMKGCPTLSARIGAGCFKHTRAHTPIAPFLRAMKATPGIGTKDRLWLRACSGDKWPRLGGVDFAGKTYLDVGCNVGFSVVEAAARGASGCLGLDVRGDVLAVANAVRDEMGLDPERVAFQRGDWLAVNVLEHALEFDIVSCMGLLHYWTSLDYQVALEMLATAAKETLILELRVGAGEGLRERGGQTIATAAWLTDRLADLGFRDAARDIREPGRRELWIARRTP